MHLGSVAKAAVTNSNDQPPAGPGEDTKLVGRDLRCALADGLRAAERLLPHLMPGAAADADVAALRRALAEVEHLAEALLDCGPGAAPPPIDPDTVVASLEPSLRQALGPDVKLTIKLAGMGASVHLATDDLEGLIWLLVEGAARAVPDGGEVTIGTGLLDHISVWPRRGYWPRRHVRLTVGDTSSGSYSETWQRVVASPAKTSRVVGSVAEIVGRLGGFLILETTADEGTRIHACLPAAPDMAKSPHTA